MYDVTDTVFRQIISGIGKPDVFFTEFVNVEGMCSIGRSNVIYRLQFTEIERPIVAQVWGINPKNFYKIAREIAGMGFDGIDLNFGCPEKSVMTHGACAALIENQELAKEIILATQEGAQKMPVSIKTRIGIKKIVTEDWITFLLQFNLATLTIHGRTAQELSDVPAHWEEIGKAVYVRNKLNQKTLIIGNGDVEDLADASEKVKQYGVDGVMIGRGIFHNPWLFNLQVTNKSTSPDEKLKLLLKHAQLFEKTWGNRKNFAILKKFFKIYCSGFSGASELRAKLMETNTVDQVDQALKEYRSG